MTPRLNAQERLERNRKLMAEKKAEIDEKTRKRKAVLTKGLRGDEVAARKEAKRAHTKHLWELAELLDEVGLSVYSAEVMRGYFADLAITVRNEAKGETLKEAIPREKEGEK